MSLWNFFWIFLFNLLNFLLISLKLFEIGLLVLCPIFFEGVFFWHYWLLHWNGQGWHFEFLLRDIGVYYFVEL